MKHKESLIIYSIFVTVMLLIMGVPFLVKDSVPINNIYRFSEEVDFKSTDGILNALDKAEEIVEEGEIFTLVITSPGGIVDAYREVLNRVNTTKLHVVTKIRAFAGSAAAMMFALGRERIMAKESRVMFHYARYIIKGVHVTEPKLKAYVSKGKFGKEVGDALKGIPKKILKEMLEGLTKTNKMLKKTLLGVFSEDQVSKLLIFGENVTLTGTEALKLGVATSVYDTAYSKKASI